MGIPKGVVERNIAHYTNGWHRIHPIVEFKKKKKHKFANYHLRYETANISTSKFEIQIRNSISTGNRPGKLVSTCSNKHIYIDEQINISRNTISGVNHSPLSFGSNSASNSSLVGSLSSLFEEPFVTSDILARLTLQMERKEKIASQLISIYPYIDEGASIYLIYK
jgi:hypothetical protein